MQTMARETAVTRNRLTPAILGVILILAGAGAGGGAAPVAAGEESVMAAVEEDFVSPPVADPGFGPWSKVVPQERAEVLAHLNRRLPAPLEDGTDMWVRPLPFYDGFQLYLARNFRWTTPVAVRFLRRGETVVVLTGDATPIHWVNQAAPLRLSEDTADDYVRFFFHHFFGSTPFVIVEKDADIRFAEDAPADLRARVAGHLKPLRLKSVTGDTFMLEATVLYGDALVSLFYVVRKDGDLTSLGEKVLVDRLPLEQRQ